MAKTLVTIIRENVEWRGQAARLALFDLIKKSRGSALSWAWLLIKPAMYIFCFWFALAVGLRVGDVDPGMPPYFLWLSAGLIPWFFMQEMLNNGIDVFRRYPYLVNRIKFPLSVIPMFTMLSNMIIQLVLQAALLVIYFACGQHLDVHLLQVPILLLLMMLFWYIFSFMMSVLSSLSRDFSNFIKSMSTPI